MPPRVLASDLLNFVNQVVKLKGWINNVRSFGKINFLILRDRTGFSQVVIEDKEEFHKISHLQPGTVLTVLGQAVASSQALLGAEVISAQIIVEVPVKEISPVDYFKPEMQSSLDFILDHRPISLRNRQIQATFKIQAAIAHAYRLFMHDVVQAVEYFAPNLIAASSEGGAEFFTVDYFGYTATLAQSSQLYKQMMVGVNERVFALMPFFRAENSHTPRHLTEGKQLEFEMGFFDHWHEILDIQEKCIKFILNYLHTYHASDLAIFGNDLIQAPQEVAFPRLSFEEAQEIFYKRTGRDEREEDDLSPAAERELCKYAQENFGTDLVFIVDWKTSKRPFYSYPNDENKELTHTFDLLCNGTEITSGGQRRHTYSSMIEGIKMKGMDPYDFEDYLTIFKFGMPPHGGFGMGLERLTMTLLKQKNIREASLFPSDPKRIAGKRLKAKIFFGAETIRNEIIRLIKDQEITFQQVTQQTDSSKDFDDLPQIEREGAIKALILKGKSSKKNYQVALPCHLKLNMKAVAETVGEKCEFESPEIIKERFGLIIGGIPPFGPLMNIETLFDEKIIENDQATFNCGLSTEFIIMKSKDLIQLVQPKIGSFTVSL